MQFMNVAIATEFYTHKSDSEKIGIADIVIKNKDVGIIIEIKYGKVKVENILLQAKEYGESIKDQHYKIFIGISVLKSKDVKMIVDINGEIS